jgi:hypothetical protein
MGPAAAIAERGCHPRASSLPSAAVRLELDVDAELAELDDCGAPPTGRVG